MANAVVIIILVLILFITVRKIRRSQKSDKYCRCSGKTCACCQSAKASVQKKTDE